MVVVVEVVMTFEFASNSACGLMDVVQAYVHTPYTAWLAAGLRVNPTSSEPLLCLTPRPLSGVGGRGTLQC